MKKQESLCSPILSGGSALEEREGTRSVDISLYRSEFEVSHSKCTQAYHTDLKHNLAPTDEFLPPDRLLLILLVIITISQRYLDLLITF